MNSLSTVFKTTGGIFGIGFIFLLASEMIALAAPAAPTRLRAQAVSATQIHLQWRDNSHKEMGFKIQQAEGTSGAFHQIATVTAGITSYRVSSLIPSATYFYRVLAYNNQGTS